MIARILPSLTLSATLFVVWILLHQSLHPATLLSALLVAVAVPLITRSLRPASVMMRRPDVLAAEQKTHGAREYVLQIKPGKGCGVELVPHGFHIQPEYAVKKAVFGDHVPEAQQENTQEKAGVRLFPRARRGRSAGPTRPIRPGGAAPERQA